MEIFRIGFLSFGIIDLLDILLVTVVFYQIYRIMRGTRATQMFAGLLVIMIAGSIAQLMGLSGMSWLISSVGAFWVVAFVILFQPELRRALTRVGELGLLRTFFRTGSEKVVSEVTKAAIELSMKRIGGLIVFQRTTGIRGVIESGIQIQAEVTSDLLVTIFFPRTPLHDGAVIISGATIVAAGCILPLTSRDIPGLKLGTRHRAAIGITEEIDAVAVVISEETGSISIVEHGKFVGRDLKEMDLRGELNRLLYPHIVEKSSLTEAKPIVAKSVHATPGGEAGA
jgi:diadenylate cyclase